MSTSKKRRKAHMTITVAGDIAAQVRDRAALLGVKVSAAGEELWRVGLAAAPPAALSITLAPRPQA